MDIPIPMSLEAALRARALHAVIGARFESFRKSLNPGNLNRLALQRLYANTCITSALDQSNAVSHR